MKTRWPELLLLAVTILCAAVFFVTYLSTVRAPGISISVERTDTAEEEEAESKGVEEAETGESTIGKLNLNTATSEELQTLPGIGEEKAEAIIRYRLQNGGFRTIEELMEVSGIGSSLFEQIQDRVTVS